MRRTSSPLVVVLLAVLTLGLASLPSPADAAPPRKVSVKDPAGDAPASVDLVSGRYAMASQPHKRVKFSAKVTQLSETTFLTFEIIPLAAGKDRLVVFRERGRTVSRLYADYNDEDPETLPRRCKRIKVTWDAGSDTVTAEIPFSCLVISVSGSPGEYYFNASSRIGGQPGSPTDRLPERVLDF